MIAVLICAVVLGVGIDALIALFGSRRNIGFGWTFIISVVFTPLIGLIAVLLSEPLPQGSEPKYGCLGYSFGCLGTIFMILVAMALLMAAIALLIPGI